MHPIIAILSEDGAGLSQPENNNSDVALLLGNFVSHKYSNDELMEISRFLVDSSEIQSANVQTEGAISVTDLSTIITNVSKKNDFISFVLLRTCALYGCQKHDNIKIDDYITILKAIRFATTEKFAKLSANLFVFYVTKYFSKVKEISFDAIKEIVAEFVNSDFKKFFDISLVSFLLKKSDSYDILNEILQTREDKELLLKNLKSIEIDGLEPNEVTNKFLGVVLDVAQESKEIDAETCSAIGNLVLAVIGENPAPEYLEKTKKILCENDFSSFKNPCFVIPFLHIFMKSEHFGECVTFINKCLEKIGNIISLHKAKVDVQIIKTVKGIQTDLDTLSPIIGTLLSIFTKIAVIASSPEVASCCLSLFNPSKEGCLSKLHSTYLATLVDIISQCVKAPAAYFTNATINVEGLTTANFMQNFFIGMWVNIPSNTPADKKNTIFSFADNNGIGFDAYIKGTTLYVIQMLKGKEAEITFGAKLQQDTWIHIGIGFVKAEKKMNVIQTINDTEFPPIESKWPDFQKNSPIKLRFGTDEECECQKGPFAMFSKQEDLQNMYKNGPRVTPKEAFSFIEPRVVNNSLVFKGTPTLVYNARIEAPLSFVDALLRSHKITAFLPIFDTLDLRFPDGEQVPVFAGAAIDLVLFASQASEKATEELIESNCLALIAECLAKTEKRNFDYAIYQKFFTVFNSERNKSLKTAILKQIILNLGLWIHASSVDQILITRHWGRVLYQEHMEFASSVIPFSDLLSLLRMYYWYTPVEKDIICCGPNSENPRDDDLNIHDIRAGILQALHYLARMNFNKESLLALVGNCVTCKDFKQVVDLLLLIKMIAVSEEQPLLNVQEDWSVFGSLHHLINCENEDISFSTIEDIAALHFLNYISTPKVKYHVALLMEMAPLSTFSLNFFGKLITFTAKYPDFLPFCFYYVMQVGEKAGFALMKYLKPIPEYGQKKFWALWPIISALYIGGDYCRQVMSFVARTSNENWKITFAIIDVVARALGVDDQQPKSFFIHSLTLSLLDQPLLSFEYLHEFFDLAIFHMFFRPKDAKSQHISAILDSLNFPYDSIESKPTTKKETRFNKMNFMKELEAVKSQIRDYQFGLRLDADGVWLDAQCGIDLIKQAKRTKVQTYHNFSAMLAAFALQDLPKEAYEQMDSIKQAKIADRTFIKFFAHRDPSIKEVLSPLEPNCFERIIRDTNEHNLEIIGKPASVCEKIAKYFSKVNEAMIEVFQNSDADIFTSSIHNVSSFANNAKSVVEMNKITLHRIHECFGADYAPFKSSVTKCEEKMIGNEYGTYGIPIKTVPLSKHLNTREESLKVIEEYLSRVQLAKIPDPMNLTLQANPQSPILLELQAQIIEKATRKECQFCILSNSIQIISDDDHVTITAPNVERILFRTIHHMQTGIEIFTRDNKTYLLSFDRFNSLTALKAIKSVPAFQDKSIQVDSPIDELLKNKYTEKWQNGEISNLEYIMNVNSIASRTFNSLSSYPICPFVLKPAANNSKPDLTKEESFRDLSQPMSKNVVTFSSPEIVSALLYNAEPFKTFSNSKQFKTYAEAYNEACEKGFELTPEFFICSSAFESNDEYYKEFGCETPEEFVSLMRQAIESEYVTKNLHKWMDIVFGINQPSVNPMMTERAWENDSDIDSVKRLETDKFMETEGVIPQLLFSANHPEFNFALKSSTLASATCIESNAGEFKITGISNSTIAGLTTDDRLVTMSFNRQTSEFSDKINIPYLHEIACVTLLDSGEVVCGTKDGFIVLHDGENGTIKATKFVSLDAVTCVESNETLLVCGTADGFVSVYDARNLEELASIPLFSGEIMNVACSDPLGLIVAVTRTNLVVISEQNKTPVFSYKLELTDSSIVPRVCITKQTGIVVVAQGKKLASFSINGKKLQEKEIGFDVHHVCYASGIDDSIIVCDNQKIVSVDPLSLAVSSQIVSLRNEYIIAVSQSCKSHSITCFTNSGQFCFFPLPQ